MHPDVGTKSAFNFEPHLQMNAIPQHRLLWYVLIDHISCHTSTKCSLSSANRQANVPGANYIDRVVLRCDQLDKVNTFVYQLCIEKNRRRVLRLAVRSIKYIYWIINYIRHWKGFAEIVSSRGIGGYYRCHGDESSLFSVSRCCCYSHGILYGIKFLVYNGEAPTSETC